MLDHIGFRVRDLAASRRFYDAAMTPLGLSVIDNTRTSFLISRSAQEPVPFLWIGSELPTYWSETSTTSASPIHLAFQARDRRAVDAFHKAALENGGTDNGPPGPRGPEAMHFYAAFVIDPDGNNIEASCRTVSR